MRLSGAAAEGDARAVERLLARGADPRPRRMTFLGEEDAATLTPLARAALSPNLAGGERVVARLLEDGRCDPLKAEYCVGTRLAPEISELKSTQLDSNLVTVVHYAAAKGRLALLATALGGWPAAPAASMANADGLYGPVATARRGRCVPLHLAALGDQGAAVAALVAAGADVSTRDCDGFDALYLAARFGCEDALSALLRAGAAVDGTTTANHTPIFLAARYGHLDAVYKLLRAGASLAVRRVPSGARSPVGYAIHKSGKDNCDGRVAEQRIVISFLEAIDRRGGIKRWCSDERFEAAKLRWLVRERRATFEPPLAFALTSEYALARPAADRWAALNRQSAALARLFRPSGLPDDLFEQVVEFWLAPRDCARDADASSGAVDSTMEDDEEMEDDDDDGGEDPDDDGEDVDDGYDGMADWAGPGPAPEDDWHYGNEVYDEARYSEGGESDIVIYEGDLEHESEHL